MVLYDVSLPAHPETRDDVGGELSAMAAVGKALSGLHDPEARLRVLRWANERFNASAALVSATAPPVTAPAPDAALAVDSLDNLFDSLPSGDAANDADGAIDDSIGDFFDEPVVRRPELRVVARNEPLMTIARDELQGLYDGDGGIDAPADAEQPIGDVFDEPIDADEPGALCLEESAEDEAPIAAQQDRPLDALLSDLVSELEELTLQFKDATA